MNEISLLGIATTGWTRNNTKTTLASQA